MAARVPVRASLYIAIIILIAAIFTSPYKPGSRSDDDQAHSYQPEGPRDGENGTVPETASVRVGTASAVASPAPNITEFPAFMRQWKAPSKSKRIMTAKGYKCNIHNTSMPHIVATTNHPTSNDITDVFARMSANFEQAWRDHDRTNTDADLSATTEAHIPAPVNTSTTAQPPANSPEIKTAACSVVKYWVTYHFPHQMQHVLTCWSLWRHFPNARHVFILSKDRYDEFTNSSAFSRGILQVLQASGVSIVQMPPQDFVGRYVTGQPDAVHAVARSSMEEGYLVVQEDDMRSWRRSTLTTLGLGQYQEVYCSANHANATAAATPASRDDTATAAASRRNAIFTSGQPDEPRIVVADRQRSRTLIGAFDIALLLQKEMNLSYIPPLLYFEGLTFAEQVEAFTNVDILVTPHGAHLTGIVFMNRCSALIEVLTHSYGYPGFYGTMAALSGVNHTFVYLGTDIAEEKAKMKTGKMKRTARAAQLCAPAHVLVEAVRTQMTRWKQCCGFMHQ